MLIIEKENIIKYEHIFKLSTDKICIMMKLAVNDLDTHQKVRKNSRHRFYFSLQCIQSIDQQALSALDYLHDKGVTDWDLKLMNILMTKWNAETNILIIKLTDFDLTGIRLKNFIHTTFCETEGYVTSKVIQGHKRLKELQKQRDKEMKTVLQSWMLSYDKFVDIWTLRKILQNLIKNILSCTSWICEKIISVNKDLTLSLIYQIMQEDFKNWSTVTECWKNLWITTNDNFNSLAQKHNRSFTSLTEQLFKRVIQRTLENSFLTDECVLIMNVIFANELNYQNDSSQGLHDMFASFDIDHSLVII